jgi:proteic killer suppression protein
MDVEFSDKDLQRLYEEKDFYAGQSREVVKAFRKRIQVIEASINEVEFYSLKSLHYEKLKGNRSHQRSMRLNKQWRLVLEIKPSKPGNIVVVISIIDYH